ncbi:synaptonemal complex protein 1 isoform X2 [Rhinatrema bivittatum]|uniref:synaptonemal complex protein 1 isoform X2 n=1 Tax=Rhinatrema bivittatum TaxID=194408 RepID=UPI00112D7F66|nr:synaptonemal complex protein 1 isoform X2 [Rhinatrema bivittatum]
MCQLYSKLYNEAEKIKRWKQSVESEMKQKEKKIQDYKKTIDAQRKAIQELQFENEKLSLKLEDEMHENKDLLNENNATRHLCDLLKETCARSEEKTNMYEVEREETRQLYVELNNNIERMIMAFEELRVQAENSRLDMYFKLKEESEKKEKLDSEYKTQLNIKEQQLTLIKQQNDERDNELINIKYQLHETMKKINDLEEIKEQQNKMLGETDEKVEELMVQFQEAKDSLEKSEDNQKTLETELQTALTKLVHITEEKEAEMEEHKEMKALHALAMDEFQVTICNLKEQLMLEKQRLKEIEDESQKLISEFQKKSTEVELMTKLKNDNDTELQELKRVLESSLMVQKDLEQEITQGKLQNKLLTEEIETKESNHGNFKGTVQDLLDEKDNLEKTVKILHETEKELQDIIQIRENKIHDLEIQVTAATAENEENLYKQIAELKEEQDKQMVKYEEITVDYSKVLLEKEQMAKDIDNAFTEVKNLQNSLKASKQNEETAKMEIETLKVIKNQLRKELESVEEMMKLKGEEAKSKLDESRDKARNIESEISKKEKLLKTLENKFNNLKKHVENKNKSIEDLQQENKTLKKKIAAESKQCSAHEAEVTQLNVRLENIRLEFEKSSDSYQKEIKEKNLTEEKLREEAERMRIIADDAQKIQKETDIRCQHKIAEMVALMEKHKHQYDKMVEEKDAELGLCKTQEQETISTKVSLEIELSCIKKEVLSLKEQLKKEIEEKKIQTSLTETPRNGSLKLDSNSVASSKKSLVQTFSSLEHSKKSENMEIPSWTPPSKCTLCTLQKTYRVKTPPKHEKVQRESINQHTEAAIKKKRKVALEFDAHSDSSEHIDLLSMVSEEEMFKRLYKDHPEAAPLCMTSLKKVPSSVSKSPGNVLKLATIKKMREAGWTAVSNMDRKKKMKAVEKLFS